MPLGESFESPSAAPPQAAQEVVKSSPSAPSSGTHSDHDLYLRLASRYPVFSHGELIGEWRRHRANTSAKSLLMLETVLAVLGGQQELVRQSRRYRAARKKGLQRARS